MEVFTGSYVPSKLRESQLLQFRDSGTKSHLDVALVERRIVYYKGEGGGFPHVQAVVSLVCLGCPWLVLAPKVLQLCINHFVLVLCRSVWMSKACHFFLVPSQSSSTPLYPSIVLRTRECAPTPCSSNVFSLGLTFESFKELGVHHFSTIALNFAKVQIQHLTTIQVQVIAWKPHNQTSQCWGFYVVNGNLLVDLEKSQMLKCIICRT